MHACGMQLINGVNTGVPMCMHHGKMNYIGAPTFEGSMPSCLTFMH